MEPLLLHPDTPAWLAWATLLAAAVVIGVAKSGFGGGIGVLAVPLVGNVLAADHAVGVMLPVLIGADLVAVAQHRRERSPRHLRPALVGAFAGIVLAALAVFALLRRDGLGGEASRDALATALAVTVGSVTLTMVALQVFRWCGGRLRRVPDTAWAGALAGALAGFVSAVAHAAGPIMTLYWLEARLDKRKLVATLVVFFFVVNVLKVPFYLLGALISPATLWVSLGMLAAVPVGSMLGLWLHRRVPEGPFTAVMYVAAAIAGARMLGQALG
ncbi:MAG: sulfite exporter TauE/SafE family protein [Planctomycetota bacterium]